MGRALEPRLDALLPRKAEPRVARAAGEVAAKAAIVNGGGCAVRVRECAACPSAMDNWGGQCFSADGAGTIGKGRFCTATSAQLRHDWFNRSTVYNSRKFQCGPGFAHHPPAGSV